MEIIMRKAITLLLVSILLCVGCTNEGAVQEQETTAPENKVEADVANEDKEENTEKKTKQQGTYSPLTVHYIDAGQGDATLLEFTDEDDSYTILYDAGDWQGNEVVPYLQQENIETIDIVIISHPHADHIGQLTDVLTEFEVGEVWMTENTANSSVYEEAVEAILASDADYDEPQAGDVFDIGPLTLSVLHPETLTGGLNEDSLAVHFSYGDMAFLFTGDAYMAQEEAMIASGANVDAQFLHLGHHGSKTSSSEKFLDAVDPTYAIYSAGTGNSYGHPHQEVLDKLQVNDITVYGTDVHGNIVVTTDGVDAEVTTEKTGEVVAGTEQKSSSDKKETPIDEDKQEQEPEQTETEAKQNNCIDLNTASDTELQEIIHIGEQRVNDVIASRPFSSVDDLQRVDGFGPARMDDIKAENIACVGGN